ncbi:MAG: hypothetical protein O2843_10325, partial [Chloroflexi bacterium]|nr:hypothetical protein [Chloroflexota bacterium]
APFRTRSRMVETRRWTTAWLIDALTRAGFAEVRGTAHPGELARRVVRSLRTAGSFDAVAPQFDALTWALGEAAARTPGDEMVLAVR